MSDRVTFYRISSPRTLGDASSVLLQLGVRPLTRAVVYPFFSRLCLYRSSRSLLCKGMIF